MNIIKVVFLGCFIPFLTSCLATSMFSGKKEYPKEDVSGRNQVIVELPLSTKGRAFPDQRIRFDFIGKNLEKFTKNKSVYVDVRVLTKTKNDGLFLQSSNFVKMTFDSVPAQKDKKLHVHHGLLRRDEGAYFATIAVSGLTKSVDNLEFEISFTDKLPPETFLKTRIAWSDGP